MDSDAICWMNGTLLAAAQARVSVLDHGLLYGDGVFEGIRFYLKTPYRDGTTQVMLLRASCPKPFGPAFGCSRLLLAPRIAIAAAGPELFGEWDGWLRKGMRRDNN